VLVSGQDFPVDILGASSNLRGDVAGVEDQVQQLEPFAPAAGKPCGTIISDDSSDSSSTIVFSSRPDFTKETLDTDDIMLLEAVSTDVPCNVAQQGFIPILEARGGADKGPDGHRKDTMPIALAIAATSTCRTAVYHFLEESVEGSLAEQAIKSNNAVRKLCLAQASAVVVRVNPGTLTPYCTVNQA
jgi:hypothetical protein